MPFTQRDPRTQLSSNASKGAAGLRNFVLREIADGGLTVISNREPYSHEMEQGRVNVHRPASGLVSAIEPVLRACGGMWIAYGGGSADRAYSDVQGKLSVPPGDPDYTLRRLWIEDVEYDSYYKGFANEGLWPLCHIAHTKPLFRSADWDAYQSVNASFARAAVEETADNGMVLLQDYHFALAPRMIRERAPHLITSLFWHIPWPNPDLFGICPWKEAILEGMLGADVVGFHTAGYCLNFLDSARRHLECRVDMEQMSVTFRHHQTLVRPYPISVPWPYVPAAAVDGQALRSALGIDADVHVALGVDRADYTKGLLERLAAVEILLEQNPALREHFVFLQLASPTRSLIPKYQQLAVELRSMADRINCRFGTESWMPVLLHMRIFTPEEVRTHYRMADSALVTPLHDGMNLVAKEYVAACDDGNGILVLSTFAGAARELDGALIVNPYDTQDTADAILRAITMPVVEKRARMQVMRDQIAGHSIYDWSHALLQDMTEARGRRSHFWPGLRNSGSTLPLAAGK